MFDFNYQPRPEHIKAARAFQDEQTLEVAEAVHDANVMLWDVMFYLNEDCDIVSKITGRVRKV